MVAFGSEYKVFIGKKCDGYTDDLTDGKYDHVVQMVWLGQEV